MTTDKSGPACENCAELQRQIDRLIEVHRIDAAVQIAAGLAANPEHAHCDTDWHNNEAIARADDLLARLGGGDE